MTTTNAIESRVEAAVRGYFAAFAALDAAAAAALFADDATVEDPVGSPVIRGKEAIQAFYKKSMAMKAQLTLHEPIRIRGRQAAFAFQAKVDMPDGSVAIDVIDVMTFDEEGKITSMRAFFGDGNIHPL